MAFNDRLKTRTQPFLEPGEEIEQIYVARGGANPWLFLWTGLILMVVAVTARPSLYRPYVVARTNRSLVLLDADLNGTKPKKIYKRLPRETVVGPLSGIWAGTIIDGEKIWIHRKFKKTATAPVRVA